MPRKKPAPPQDPPRPRRARASRSRPAPDAEPVRTNGVLCWPSTGQPLTAEEVTAWEARQA